MLPKPSAVIYRMDGADKGMMAVLAVVSAPVIRSDMPVSDDRTAVAIRTFLLIGIINDGNGFVLSLDILVSSKC